MDSSFSTDTLDDTPLQPSGNNKNFFQFEIVLIYSTGEFQRMVVKSSRNENGCTLSQDGVLLLDARQYPLLHAGHSLRRVHDDGHRCLHLLLHGLLLHHHERATVYFLDRD